MVIPTLLLQVQAPEGTQETIESYNITPETVLGAIVVVLVAYLLSRAIDHVMMVLADRLLVHRFRVTLLIPIVQVVVYAIAAYAIVDMTIDPSREQMIAFAGLFGAAMGFGLKELVADVLGGLAIVIERPYRIGDKVSIDTHYGEVVDIGIRSTQLLTLDDDLITVPNHVFFQDSIVNANAGSAEMLVTVEFHAALDADPTTASRIIEEALATSQYVYVTDAHPVVTRLDNSPFYYTITGKAYVNDLRNEAVFRTDVSERVLTAFHKQGIDPPPPAAQVGRGDYSP